MQCFKVFLLCLTSFVMTILKTISVFNRKRLDNAFASWREVCDVLLAQLLRLSSYKASGKSYVLRGFCSYILANEIRGMTQKAWKWQCRKKNKRASGIPSKTRRMGWMKRTDYCGFVTDPQSQLGIEKRVLTISWNSFSWGVKPGTVNQELLVFSLKKLYNPMSITFSGTELQILLAWTQM